MWFKIVIWCYMAMTQKTGMDRYAMIQTYLCGTKELHKWSQKISISSKGYGLGPWGYGTRVWIASGVVDRDLTFWWSDGPVVTPVIFLWVKQCHKKPSPRKISILIGGMFTIPSHGWVVYYYYCFNHITINHHYQSPLITIITHITTFWSHRSLKA